MHLPFDEVVGVEAGDEAGDVEAGDDGAEELESPVAEAEQPALGVDEQLSAHL